MTPSQVALVRSSFAQVKEVRELAAALFYARLFQLDPSLRPLFRNDMKEQGRKLMATLALLVEDLEHMDRLAAPLADLGERHRGYGVKDAMYATVGDALLWTLEQKLGEGFTPDHRAAWAMAYQAASRVMMGDVAHAA